jgi:hypothetical protein
MSAVKTDAVKKGIEEVELDLGWMSQQGERVPKASPGSRGITLSDIQIGSYGELPEHSDNQTGRPRGSIPRPDGFRVGAYEVRSKSEVWLENAAGLYEEALQRQWSSATDIPWHTIKELPDDIEQAQCQLATFLTEVEFVAADVPARWIAKTTPDYHEPRLLLLAQIMDESRHLDVFRKRALANGGGLMSRTGGTAGVVGSIDMSRDFTEMSSRLHISGEGAVLTIFRMGELMAYNDAEKYIYRLCGQDEARHVAFGVLHMRYMAEAAPERREEIHCYLDDSERNLIGQQNPAAGLTTSSESLAVLLGGGKDNYDEGYKKLLAIRKRQVREYMQRVKSAGFGERFENGRSNPELLAYANAA